MTAIDYVPSNDDPNKIHFYVSAVGKNEDEHPCMEIETVLTTTNNSMYWSIPAATALNIGVKPSMVKGNRVRAAADGTGNMLVMKPAVRLTISFRKLDGEIDSRACIVVCACDEMEYEQAFLEYQRKLGLSHVNPLAVEKQNSCDSSSDSTPETTVIARIQLSPIAHLSSAGSSPFWSSSRTIIIPRVLHQLGAYINSNSSELIIQQSYVLYEDSVELEDDESAF